MVSCSAAMVSTMSRMRVERTRVTASNSAASVATVELEFSASCGDEASAMSVSSLTLVISRPRVLMCRRVCTPSGCKVVAR